ncbi:hypothetical protein PBOI14_20270 [Pseudomonas sp. Boi14]|nr:hypothetical protein PBOI14_20270 [Pseudomonas sp. Boi14]
MQPEGSKIQPWQKPSKQNPPHMCHHFILQRVGQLREKRQTESLKEVALGLGEVSLGEPCS